jgi:threonine dehydrogenase-like Zn-dependent dehydrogenase
VAIREELLAPMKPAEALVRSRLIGISHGTELLAFRGELPAELPTDETLGSLPGTLRYPLKYGYINVGEANTAQGARRVFAFFPHQDWFCLPETQLLPLPDGLSFDDAVFLANMETALGIVHDLAPRYGETVLLVGQGVVGLLVAGILREAGVDRIAVEPLALRREASHELGCRVLDPASGGVSEQVYGATKGRGADLAVECSGTAAGLQLAVDCLAFEGTVIEASWFGSREVSLKLGTAFHRKRLHLRSSQVSRVASELGGRWDKARRFAVVLDLLRRLKPARYITQRFALDRGQEAFELLDRRPGECIQVVLEP